VVASVVGGEKKNPMQCLGREGEKKIKERKKSNSEHIRQKHLKHKTGGEMGAITGHKKKTNKIMMQNIQTGYIQNYQKTEPFGEGLFLGGGWGMARRRERGGWGVKTNPHVSAEW